MSEVRYAWPKGKNAGRLGGLRGAPATLQNALALLVWEFGPDVRCDADCWFASSLLTSPLPWGTVERYPEFCPVYVGAEMVAVLLR